MHTTRTTPGKMSPIEELREKVIQQKERTRLLKERSYAILAKAARRRGARPERSITYQSRRQNVLHDLQELNRSSEEKRQHNIAMRENSTPLYLKPRLTPPTKDISTKPSNLLFEKTPASDLTPHNAWGRSA
jgi:hypothetical protein